MFAPQIGPDTSTPHHQLGVHYCFLRVAPLPLLSKAFKVPSERWLHKTEAKYTHKTHNTKAQSHTDIVTGLHGAKVVADSDQIVETVVHFALLVERLGGVLLLPSFDGSSAHSSVLRDEFVRLVLCALVGALERLARVARAAVNARARARLRVGHIELVLMGALWLRYVHTQWRQSSGVCAVSRRRVCQKLSHIECFNWERDKGFQFDLHFLNL